MSRHQADGSSTAFYLATSHPVLSGFDKPRLSIHAGGYFTWWPDDATILLCHTMLQLDIASFSHQLERHAPATGHRPGRARSGRLHRIVERVNLLERGSPMKKIALSLLLACLALLSLTACFPPGRGAKTLHDWTPDRVLAIDLWIDHEQYDFGEPVNVRAKLTNISGEVVHLRSKSGSDPVMDIIIETSTSAEPMEELTWSQAHPDDVLYILELAPGQSYEIRWSQALSQRRGYRVKVPWVDHTGYLRDSWLAIAYDLSLPNP